MTYYANYTLLRLKHCLRRHVECTSRNEFERRFSRLLATFRATIGSVSTNIKNSGLLARIQDGDEENRAAPRKLRANYEQFCGCFGPQRKQIDVKV